MRALFVGGTGIISSAVSKLAVERGVELCLFNRGSRTDFVPAGATVIRGDIRDTKEAARQLKDCKFDVVVDWIAYKPEHVEADIELFAGKVSQYIFISSASAYQKPPEHYLITEATPLSNPYWQYSRDKIACEQRLMAEYEQSGFPVTIVRPSHTYGLTQIPAALNSWQKPWTIVDRMRRERPVIVHGDGTGLWPVTHNTDFAKGFVGLMGNEQAVGEAFHITTDEVLNWNQIYEAIGKAAAPQGQGVEPKMVHIPSEFVAKFNEDEGASLLGDKAYSVVFDNSKIRRFVPDYVPTVGFAEGVKRSVEWFEADKTRQIVDEQYNRFLDDVLDAYER